MSTTPSMFPDDYPLPAPPAKVPARPAAHPIVESSGKQSKRRQIKSSHGTERAVAVAPARMFDLTEDIRSLIRQLVQLDSLRHIDPTRLLVGVTISRTSKNHGVMASCMPLRFDGGERQLVQPSGKVWIWPKVTFDGKEVLYNLSFTVPRLLNNTLAFKLETVIHELFHISPKFDGTLRILGKGRHRYHGPSREHYDRLIRPIWTEAMRVIDLSQYVFLNHQAVSIRKKFAAITGLRARRLAPRLIGGGTGSNAPPVDWEHGESE